MISTWPKLGRCNAPRGTFQGRALQWTEGMKFKKNEGENKGFFLPGGPFSDNSTNLKRNFAKYVVLHRFTITNYRSMFLNAIW